MECITGPISKIISSKGMPAVYEALDAEGKKVFEKVLLMQLHSWNVGVLASSAGQTELPHFHCRHTRRR